MTDISVIVPVYNTENYICRCIDSILAQTYKNFELILIDDGSSDSSGKICDKYASADPRIRVFHQKNQGQASARNYGIMKSKGNWLHFVDSDDAIHPRTLELLSRVALDTKANIIACDVVESQQVPINFNEEMEYSYRFCEVNESCLYEFYKTDFRHYWIVWAKLIRSDIVKSKMFSSGRIYEDNAIMCQWLYQAKYFAYIPQQMYFYQANPEGTTKGEFKAQKLDYLWALDEQIQFYNRIKFKKMMSALCTRFMTSATNYFLIVHNELHDEELEKNIQRSMLRIVCKYFAYIKLTKHEFIHAVEVFFPNLIHYLYAVKSRIVRKI